MPPLKSCPLLGVGVIGDCASYDEIPLSMVEQIFGGDFICPLDEMTFCSEACPSMPENYIRDIEGLRQDAALSDCLVD